MTKVYFIRHAEPDYSNKNDMERSLTPKGMKDRELVSSFLCDKDIDIVLSSPYRRAVLTVKDFSDKYGLEIKTVYDFRERKIDSCWIEDFNAFSKKQWEDFDYKLSDGESLREVQDRNIKALKKVLNECQGKNIVIGSHGTALSTIINYFDNSFGYDEFEKIKNLMPWAVEFVFDDYGKCTEINKYNL